MIVRPGDDQVVRIVCDAAPDGAALQAKPTREAEAYATATFTDTWTERFGDETIEGRYYGAAHTSAGWPHTTSSPKARSTPRPRNWMKKPRPNRPNTMLGTPARLLTEKRTDRVNHESGRAYSCR